MALVVMVFSGRCADGGLMVAAFLPFDTFTHPLALASDLPVDCLVWAFFLIHLNTAYKSSRSKSAAPP